MSRRELLACVGVLAIAIAILPALGGGVLWTHPAWLDELCCTLIPTEASSPAGVVANLARRQDFAPPMLHLIVWTVKSVAGGMTLALLRSIALFFMSLACVMTYATLRRHFDRFSSACGTLAMASHPLVLLHSFEGRFYGPWMFFAAAWAWSVGRRDRFGSVLQGVFAVCVVTIHWFGALSLGLMAAGVVASFGRGRWRDGVRAVMPSSAAIVALVAVLPLLLAQFKSVGELQWLEKFTLGQLPELIRFFFLTAVPALAVGLLVIEALRHDRPGPRAAVARVTDALRQPGIAALAALAAMPVVLAVLSIIAQPAMLGRYGITTALSLAPLVAVAVAPLGRGLRVAALIIVLLPFKPNVRNTINDRTGYTQRVQADALTFERVRYVGVPVAWPWLHSIWPVIGPQRGNQGPAVFLDVPDSALAILYPGDRIAWFRRRIRVEIANARSHQVVYGFPKVVTTAELDTVKRFAMMTTDLRVRGGLRQAEYWARVVFPHHRVLRLDDHVSFFERVP